MPKRSNNYLARMRSRGKVIGLSICLSICLSVYLSVDTKITRSRDLGLRVSEKCYQNVGNGEKLTCLCF